MLKRTFAKRLIPALLVLAAATSTLALAGQRGQMPTGPRPEQFTYPPLNFKIPKASDFRTTLGNGLVVYIAEDHEIPWFTGSLLVRTGPFLEPKDKLGVDAFTNAIIRSGGSTTMTGEQINERMDFLAGTVTATSLSVHMRSLDEGLKIWTDILMNPAFPDDKLRREKESVLPGIRNRNRGANQTDQDRHHRLRAHRPAAPARL
jgi:zinc protease